jgi:hypothetical protein
MTTAPGSEFVPNSKASIFSTAISCALDKTMSIDWNDPNDRAIMFDSIDHSSSFARSATIQVWILDP